MVSIITAGSIMSINLIYATSLNGVMGKDNHLPWPSIPEDLDHFQRLTYGGAVVMGRKTWESLPESVRPLRGRRNIVLSKNPDYALQGVELFTRPAELFEILGDDRHQPVWIIGGPSLLQYYEPYASRLVITTVELEVEGDVMAPKIPLERWSLTKERRYRSKLNQINFTVREYLRPRITQTLKG